jgi:hypothetical protein
VLVSFGRRFVDDPQHRGLRRMQSEHDATAGDDLLDRAPDAMSPPRAFS